MTIQISFSASDDPLTAYVVVRNLLRAGFPVVRCGCGSVDVEGPASRQLLSRLRRLVHELGVRCDVFAIGQSEDGIVEADRG